MRRFLAAGLAAVLLLTLSGSALAAKGGNKGGNSGTGPTSASIVVPDGPFAGTTTATVNPGGGTWVYAACSQAGVVVYQQYAKSDTSNQVVLYLGPTPMWTSGSANCVAEEGYWGSNGAWRTIASTTFNVAG